MKCLCPVVCVCNCHVLKHVLKQWTVQISSIYSCDWYWYAFYDFCTLLVFRSTAAALCNYNENTFVCSYVVCTCANTFVMLCICREFHGVSMLWSKAWRWSTRVNVNDTRLTCDKSVHLFVHLALDKYVKVKCLSKPIRPIRQRWSPVPWPSASQSYKTINTGPVRCVLCLFTSQLSPSAKLYCLMTQTVECKNLSNMNASPTHIR